MPAADPPPTHAAPSPGSSPSDVCDICDVCGRQELYELRCKVVCANCRSVVRSCADLG